MEKILVKFINSGYRIIKLNSLFIFFTLVGLIIFGIGPSWLTVKEIDRHYYEEDKKITFKEMLTLFKNNLKKGNALFYLWSFIISVISYNIYIGFQIENMFVLMLTIFLLVILLFTIVFGFYVFEIASVFDIKIIDNLKLGFYGLFINLRSLVTSMTVILLIGYVSYLNLGLLLFMTMGSLIFVPRLILNKIMLNIDRKLVHE